MTFKPARLLMMLIAVAAMPVMAQNVAVVNGKPIPKARFDAIVNDVEAQGQGRKVDEEMRKQIKDTLITMEELSQEAEKQGIGKDADVKEKIAFLREQSLARALVEKHTKAYVPSDADINAKYAVIKAETENREQYQARHILVATEDEAKAIIVKLKGGAKFEDLAKEKSTDQSNAKNGGDLGWAAPGTYVPSFSQALVKLEKGHFSEEPVQTQFGYHVILLEDKRKDPTPVPALADVKPRLVEIMREEDKQKFIKGIRDKAVIGK
jgi:peptidyl-prolyl cis-trans isomerase C